MSRNRFGGLVGLVLLVGILSGALPVAADPCPADYNGDGFVTPQDIYDFLEIWYLLPKVDFNADGVVSTQDIYDFAAAYGAGLPSADYNGSGTVSVDDLSAFMADWYTVTGSPSTDFDGDGRVTNDEDDIFIFLELWRIGC